MFHKLINTINNATKKGSVRLSLKSEALLMFLCPFHKKNISFSEEQIQKLEKIKKMIDKKISFTNDKNQLRKKMTNVDIQKDNTHQNNTRRP